MTERKPSGDSFETWVDKQIREAVDRGEFDNLPGAGKPLLGLDAPDDELWWVKDYLRREGLSTAVRELVKELNPRIATWLRAPSGPYLPLGPVNAENVVQRWRTDRGTTTPRLTAKPPADHVATTESPSQWTRWRHRITRRRRTSD